VCDDIASDWLGMFVSWTTLDGRWLS
jgi:hypothetical protein